MSDMPSDDQPPAPSVPPTPAPPPPSAEPGQWPPASSAPPAYGQPAPPPPGQQWQQQGYGYGAAAAPKTLGMATAALVCGIVGLLIFNIVLGPLALVFGIIARNKIRASNGTLKGEGYALAGIILGPIDVVVWLAIIAAMS